MKHIFTISLCFLALSLSAQTVVPIANDVRLEEKLAIEKLMVDGSLNFNVSTRGIETPPEFSQLRTAAEWEEIEVLTIAWEGFPCILKQIVAASVSECRVVVFTESPKSTSNYLTSESCGGALSLDNVDIVQADLNSIWMRDYGANTVYGSWNDDRILVDWIYNRPRPDDDVIPDLLADHMGLESYSTTAEPYELMNTGGNWMSDGFGTAFESELILDQNQGGSTWWTDYPNHTTEEIESILQDFMGVHTLINMPKLPYDGINHIDMHMKLLDESTLLVSEYPEGVADGPQINANIDYVLSNYTTKWGTPFKVVRIPSPPELNDGYPDVGGWYQSYTASVFINNTVIVPTYYEPYDSIALSIYKELLPGYNIVPIDCDGIENLSALSGAIHNITHSVSVEDPLIISHLPLPDTENTTDSYTVEAYLSHRSGIIQANLFYSFTPSGPWTEVSMSDTGDGENWTAEIPAAEEDADVFYYVSGNAASGKTGSRPMPAPEGWWTFHVSENVIYGCTTISACNYNPDATDDDGTCTEFDECGECGGDGSSCILTCVDDDDAVLAVGGCFNAVELLGCDFYWDDILISELCPESCDNCPCDNDFNDNGICDDSEVFGCTYPDAMNFDSSATIDDGSCEYASNPCPTDLDSDGSVGASDLLIFLGAFGNTCE